MNAVFNSSPIIFLIKLGLFEAALDLFDQIDIPSLVYSEVRQKPDASAGAVEDLIKGGRVSVLKAENKRLVSALNRRLGKGEAEAMRLGLAVKGTLGIVRRLMENGVFESNLEELFVSLKGMGFRIREELFWEIFSGIDQKR